MNWNWIFSCKFSVQRHLKKRFHKYHVQFLCKMVKQFFQKFTWSCDGRGIDVLSTHEWQYWHLRNELRASQSWRHLSLTVSRTISSFSVKQKIVFHEVHNRSTLRKWILKRQKDSSKKLSFILILHLWWIDQLHWMI